MWHGWRRFACTNLPVPPAAESALVFSRENMPLEQLRQYKPPLYREPDFQEFWDSTVSAAKRRRVNAHTVGTICAARRNNGG